VTQRGFNPGDILVLSPRRLIANEIKSSLAALPPGITVHSFYNDKLLEPDEAQIAICTLQLLSDPKDRVALRYWLGIGSRSWRRGQYAILREYCEQNGRAPSEVLDQTATGEIQMAGVNQLRIRYTELQAKLSRLKDFEVADLFDDLFPIEAVWAEPLRELVTEKIDSISRPQELLDLLRAEITQPEMPAEGDFVRIMSLHKSKGLTSRATIIVGCMHGLIPFVDDDLAPAERPAHLEEQRRLFYVALTRAREVLVISSARTVPRAIAHQGLNGVILGGGNRQHGNTIACQFVSELGPLAPRAIAGSTWAAGGYQ
jgi:DNA helicase-2/ATP-dependent DNA helicase PcrA